MFKKQFQHQQIQNRKELDDSLGPGVTVSGFSPIFETQLLARHFHVVTEYGGY